MPGQCTWTCRDIIICSKVAEPTEAYIHLKCDDDGEQEDDEKEELEEEEEE